MARRGRGRWGWATRRSCTAHCTRRRPRSRSETQEFRPPGEGRNGEWSEVIKWHCATGYITYTPGVVIIKWWHKQRGNLFTPLNFYIYFMIPLFFTQHVPTRAAFESNFSYVFSQLFSWLAILYGLTFSYVNALKSTFSTNEILICTYLASVLPFSLKCVLLINALKWLEYFWLPTWLYL